MSGSIISFYISLGGYPEWVNWMCIYCSTHGAHVRVWTPQSVRTPPKPLSWSYEYSLKLLMLETR